MSPEKHKLDALRIDRARAPRSRLPIMALLMLPVLLPGAAGLTWWYNRPEVVAVTTFVVREAAPATSKTLLNASGYVTARREATVSSKVSGMVIEVLVEEGMSVQADQVLARVDSSNVEKSLGLAEAQLVTARETLDETRVGIKKAELDLKRFTKLVEERIASQSELDLAQAEVNTLKARLERQEAEVTVAERQVDIWRQQLEDTIIRAPFAGVVTTKNAQPGEIISPMSAGGGFTRTGICTIVDMDSLEIEVDVSESYINRVQAGQPVSATLDAYPEWHIPSKVIAIIPTADRQKATVKVRVGFDHPDPRILPEMSVKVAFQGKDAPKELAEPGLIIPESAVQRRDGRDVVWVVEKDRLERRAVTVGTRQEGEVRIAAGIRGGEKVVVDGPETLEEGGRIMEKTE